MKVEFGEGEGKILCIECHKEGYMEKIIKETIHAKGIDIGIYTTNFENEFISLTDIAKYRNEDDRDL